ncbi:MAG: uncharacterized protein QOI47_360, partial [Actinomycetota bacterium]|nr:uncharacterized protein [Actinomycetota bacterium]
NRDPVVAYEPFDVDAALTSLRGRGLTRVVHSPSNRAEKYRHVLNDQLGVEDDVVGVLAVLLLRGPQTVNELRIRTERYEPGVPDVEAALRVLSTRDEPLVVNVGRRSGQREERWAHLLGAEPDARHPSATDEFSEAAPSKVMTSTMADRIAALEARVATLEAQLGEVLG